MFMVELYPWDILWDAVELESWSHFWGYVIYDIYCIIMCDFFAFCGLIQWVLVGIEAEKWEMWCWWCLQWRRWCISSCFRACVSPLCQVSVMHNTFTI